MTLTEFLLARIAEDEESVSQFGHSPRETGLEEADPARVLAECEAKRRIVELVYEHAAVVDGEWDCAHSAYDIRHGDCGAFIEDEEPVLRALALPYADHPDYREEWRP